CGAAPVPHEARGKSEVNVGSPEVGRCLAGVEFFRRDIRVHGHLIAPMHEVLRSGTGYGAQPLFPTARPPGTVIAHIALLAFRPEAHILGIKSLILMADNRTGTGSSPFEAIWRSKRIQAR